MNSSRNIHRPTRRQSVGNAILEAASVVDTTAVARRLEAFTSAHVAYDAAQNAVVEATERVGAIRAGIAKGADPIDAAVDNLVIALIVDRRPRPNPLSHYGAPRQSAIAHMASVPKARTVLALVAGLEADDTLSAASRKATAAARVAAETVVEAARPLGPAETALRQARLARDGLGRNWDQALVNLKSDARIASNEGHDDLYTLLFAAIDNAKKAKSVAVEEEGGAAVIDSAAPVEEEAKAA